MAENLPFRVVDPFNNCAAGLVVTDINWQKCVICQVDKPHENSSALLITVIKQRLA